MCDETIGTGWWRFISCLFLSHKKKERGKSLDFHTSDHLQCLRLYEVPMAKSDLPPLQRLTQSASGYAAHLLIPPPRTVAQVQLGIKDQDATWIRVSVLISREVRVGECYSRIFSVKNIPRNKYGFALLYNSSARRWNANTTVKLVLLLHHNLPSCHAALHPSIHHLPNAHKVTQ